MNITTNNITKEYFSNWLHNWINERKVAGVQIDERQYQCDKLYEMVTLMDFRKFVLSAAPNSGKTLMSIIYIDWCIFVNPNYKVLVLTNGLQLLRDQFLDEAKQYKAGFEYNPNVIVQLPHSNAKIQKLVDEVDLVIVDEAHQFYWVVNGMVQTLIDNLKPKRQLFLTATPSEFIRFNNTVGNEHKKYHISYLTLHTLWEQGFVQDVLVEVASSTYNFGINDFEKDGEVRSTRKFSEAEMKVTINNLLAKIIDRLRADIKADPEKYKLDIINHKEIHLRNHIGKTMIVCRNIKEAIWVEESLINYGYTSNNIVRSTHGQSSDHDLKNFKKPEVKFAIVVFKGILGFNYPDMCNIIDLSGSRNANRILQLYCRLVRKSEVVDKFYYKVVPTELVDYFKDHMAAVLHLSHEEWLSKFDGNNFNELPIVPRKVSEKIETETESNELEDSDTTKKITRPKSLSLNYIFKLNPLWHKGSEIIDSKAYITMNQVMMKINGYRPDYKNMTKDEAELMLAQLFEEYQQLNKTQL